MPKGDQLNQQSRTTTVRIIRLVNVLLQFAWYVNIRWFKYTAYLPDLDTTWKFSPTEPFGFHDWGHNADRTKPNVLLNNHSQIQATTVTPRVGSKIRGLQLSKLNDAQKYELALLITKRCIVMCRDQASKTLVLENIKSSGGISVSFIPMYASSGCYVMLANDIT